MRLLVSLCIEINIQVMDLPRIGVFTLSFMPNGHHQMSQTTSLNYCNIVICPYNLILWEWINLTLALQWKYLLYFIFADTAFLLSKADLHYYDFFKIYIYFFLLLLFSRENSLPFWDWAFFNAVNFYFKNCIFWLN